MLRKLWLDEGGAVLSTELILILVMLVIGLVVGLQAVKTAVVVKLTDIAGAIATIDASYGFSGAAYEGSVFDGYTNGSEYLSSTTVNAGSYGTEEIGLGVLNCNSATGNVDQLNSYGPD